MLFTEECNRLFNTAFSLAKVTQKLLLLTSVRLNSFEFNVRIDNSASGWAETKPVSNFCI